MSPKTGRPPSSNPKRHETRIRMDDDDIEMLEYCCKVLEITKAEVIRLGVKEVYESAKSMEHWTGLEDFKKHLHGKKK